MINVELAQFLVTTISFVFAYLICATLVGVFRAWVVDMLGDPTPRLMGFLTFNPIAHIDPFGLIFLLYFHFGWGRHVPITPHNIHPPHRYLKLACAYLSRPIAHLLLASAGISALVLAFGTRILSMAHYMVLSGEMKQIFLAHAFPHSSSFAISIAFILLIVVYLNVILGVLDLIIDGFYLALLLVAERSPQVIQYSQYVLILLPLILILFLSNILRTKLIMPFILHVGHLVAWLFGIA